MRLNSFKYALILTSVTALLVTGCSEFGHSKLKLSGRHATSIIGTPLQYSYFIQNSNYFETRYNQSTNQWVERNKIIDELMGVIDKDFNKFEKDIRSDYSYKEIIVKLASLGLTGAGSLAGKTTANILAAIDTGLKGANDAVNLDAWQNDAPEIIINQMIATREPIRAQIYANKTNTVAVYSLDDAILDLGHFYEAASVTRALASLNATTGTQAGDSTTNAASIKMKAMSLGQPK